MQQLLKLSDWDCTKIQAYLDLLVQSIKQLYNACLQFNVASHQDAFPLGFEML